MVKVTTRDLVSIQVGFPASGKFVVGAPVPTLAFPFKLVSQRVGSFQQVEQEIPIKFPFKLVSQRVGSPEYYYGAYEQRNGFHSSWFPSEWEVSERPLPLACLLVVSIQVGFPASGKSKLSRFLPLQALINSIQVGFPASGKRQVLLPVYLLTRMVSSIQVGFPASGKSLNFVGAQAQWDRSIQVGFPASGKRVRLADLTQ